MKRMLLLFLILLGPGLSLAQVPDDPFPKLTRWVDKTPRSLTDDLPALCEYLIQKCETDTQKAWVIYRWISRNIAYDREALESDKWRINRNIRDILSRRKALCFGYAQLFERMAGEVGLQAVRISGYSKGTLTAQANMDAADHAWNAVKLDGEWALLDVTWDSSLIQGSNDFVQTYQEAYFLTTPEKFLINHLPLQPMWQLLDCPLQASEFNAPPDTILARVANRPACFSYPDSIEVFLNLPLAEQKYTEARIAFEFNPSLANQREFGHALVDYATRTSDEADAYQFSDPEKYVSLQETALQALDSADSLTTFYDWQKELYADLLVNLSVFQYNQLDPAAFSKSQLKQEFEKWIQRINQATKILEGVEGSFMATQKIQACKNYLEVMREELNRLER